MKQLLRVLTIVALLIVPTAALAPESHGSAAPEFAILFSLGKLVGLTASDLSIQRVFALILRCPPNPGKTKDRTKDRLPRVQKMAGF